MYYNFELTIPKNTPMTTPTKLNVKVVRGVVHKIRIKFPPGCAGLAHVRIQHGLHSVAPTNPDGWYTEDTFPIEYDEFYEIKKDIDVLTLLGYNEDDTFDHTVYFGIGILPKVILLPGMILAKMLEKIGKLIF